MRVSVRVGRGEWRGDVDLMLGWLRERQVVTTRPKILTHVVPSFAPLTHTVL